MKWVRLSAFNEGIHCKCHIIICFGTLSHTGGNTKWVNSCNQQIILLCRFSLSLNAVVTTAKHFFLRLMKIVIAKVSALEGGLKFYHETLLPVLIFN